MPAIGFKLPERFYLSFFVGGAKLSLGAWVFIARPTHDWLVTLRQTSRFSPRGECEEAGRPGPPPLFFHKLKYFKIQLSLALLQHPMVFGRLRAEAAVLLLVRPTLPEALVVPNTTNKRSPGFSTLQDPPSKRLMVWHPPRGFDFYYALLLGGSTSTNRR
jgi:hypothetical protein